MRGAAPLVLAVKSAPAGVLLRVDEARHSCWFGAWLAQVPSATNLGLMALERAGSVAEALALAPEIGIPHQNAVIGDRAGHIAWTIFGRIPADTGAARARAAVTWTTAADQPRIVDPPLGRIWTANARVAADEHQLQLIGGDVAPLGAEYDLGARAGQIRDDLLALSADLTPADMLRIQLDDRALFLARWRTLLLGVLDEAAVQAEPRRAEFRRLIEGWDARAGTDSVGYRLVRAYRDRTEQAVWDILLAALHLPADEDRPPPAQFEGPLWQLLTERPLHLLARDYADWPEFLRAQVDATIAELAAQLARSCRAAPGVPTTRRASAIRCRARCRGSPPTSTCRPWNCREITTCHGYRTAPSAPPSVSPSRPGHESEGYLHLPGGQSGHPLSPYYRAGFMQWARGEPLPFLPGPTEHTLTLTPD